MRSPEFGARVALDADAVVLYADGEFDMTGLPVFQQALQEAQETGHASLIVDLSGVTFIGSSGLAGLVIAHKEFADVTLRGVSMSVMRIIDIAGLGGVFIID